MEYSQAAVAGVTTSTSRGESGNMTGAAAATVTDNPRHTNSHTLNWFL